MRMRDEGERRRRGGRGRGKMEGLWAGSFFSRLPRGAFLEVGIAPPGCVVDELIGLEDTAPTSRSSFLLSSSQSGFTC